MKVSSTAHCERTISITQEVIRTIHQIHIQTVLLCYVLLSLYIFCGFTCCTCPHKSGLVYWHLDNRVIAPRLPQWHWIKSVCRNDRYQTTLKHNKARTIHNSWDVPELCPFVVGCDVMNIDWLERPISRLCLDDLKIGIGFIKQRDVNAIAISFP